MEQFYIWFYLLNIIYTHLTKYLPKDFTFEKLIHSQKLLRTDWVNHSYSRIRHCRRSEVLICKSTIIVAVFEGSPLKMTIQRAGEEECHYGEFRVFGLWIYGFDFPNFGFMGFDCMSLYLWVSIAWAWFTAFRN